MGTVFSIDVRAPGVAAPVLERVLRWLHHVDATFSTYRADSEISRLGRGELRPAACSPEVREVLARCAELEDETDGYFSAYPDGRLDPSGYVKGWAIERAADLLADAGSTNHCINGGGDVQTLGRPAPERPWTVGIADPRRPGELVATVPGPPDGAPLAVATSGTAERGAHVLDPHTGRAPEGPVAVTVVGSRLSVVDAYATAAFARGPGALAWLRGIPGLSGLVVDDTVTVFGVPSAAAR